MAEDGIILDALNRIQQYESSLDQHNLVFKDFCILPLIHIRLYNHQLEILGKAPKPLRSRISHLKQLVTKTRTKTDLRLDIPIETNLLAMGVTNHRTEFFEGRYFNRILDAIRMLLPDDIRWTMLEASAGTKELAPTFFPVLRFDQIKKELQNRIFIQAALGFPGIDKNLIRNIKQALAGLGADKEWWKEILIDALYIDQLADVIVKSCQTVNVRGFVTDVFYGQENSAFLLAAHRLAIPSIDIQHGVQGDLHFAYSHAQHYQAGLYHLLPTIFWNWTANDAQGIIRSFPKNLNLKTIVGFEPMKGAIGKSLIKIESTDHLLDLKSSGRPMVLVTLNDLLHKASQDLTEAVQRINKLVPNINWILRPHPQFMEVGRSWFETMNWPKDCQTYFHDPKAENLYGILDAIDLHVTFDSTVALQALDFGVKTVLLSMNGVNYFRANVDMGEMIFINSAELPDFISQSFSKNKLATANQEIKDWDRALYEMSSILGIS